MSRPVLRSYAFQIHTLFFVHLLSGLIAYCHQPKKPSLDLAALGIELPA